MIFDEFLLGLKWMKKWNLIVPFFLRRDKLNNVSRSKKNTIWIDSSLDVFLQTESHYCFVIEIVRTVVYTHPRVHGRNTGQVKLVP